MRFDTQRQKEFVLEAVQQISIPVPLAKEVATIVEAIEAATVGACPCPEVEKDG